MSSNLFKPRVSRRRFLQASGVASVATVGLSALPGLSTLQKANAASVDGKAASTVITKNVCHQCPARCGIDVYTTNGRVHAIYGTPDHPISNGKLCPKGHLGQYILYDPDRFKGPMKRTNPKKGRNEDPKFVPISWDEALDTVAARLNALRDKGESHRFAALAGRGWGPADDGLHGDWGKLYGSPNVAIGHSSTCADASKKVKLVQDGNKSYNSYDYVNTNYMLIFGAAFLEAYRPFNNNLQAWGIMRTKSPRTQVTVVDVHTTTTGAAADRLLTIKPGTDGALALAIAHVILTEGLWERSFIGDFLPVTQPEDPAAPRIAQPKFEKGMVLDPTSFQEKWGLGLIEWWNRVLKDTTPQWAENITSISAKDILTTAREFGATRPAMAVFERGPTTHTNGLYNGMAIHALNALVGNLFAKGGMGYQMKTPFGKLSVKADEFMDDYANAPERKVPRVDLTKTDKWPMVSTMIQEVAQNHLAGKPYKLDTIMFYLNGPVYSSPDCTVWEKALADMFVIDTSPSPQETSHFADLILPDHTYLERWQISETYPFQGYPIAMIRVPAVKPLYDTKHYGDVLIELGKRIKGPMSEYYKKVGNVENIVAAVAKGFEKTPGDNGVNNLETFKAKGFWVKKPYDFRQVRGDFFKWDGKGYNTLLSAEDVQKELLMTPSGKFEFNSSYLAEEKHASYIQKELGIPAEIAGLPQYIPAQYNGGGDLHLITPKLALQAEGRIGNLPHAHSRMQPTQGGVKTVYLEIHPATAAKRGIQDGDRVRIKSSVGAIECHARLYGGTRPDTVILPNIHGHWGTGRWAKNRGISGSVNEVIPNVSEPVSGLVCYSGAKVFVEKV